MVTPEDIFKELQCCTMTITITNPDGISMNAAVNAEAHSCYPGHSENTHCISYTAVITHCRDVEILPELMATFW
jgi:hypothetical protein